jgi:hypothetical protein
MEENILPLLDEESRIFKDYKFTKWNEKEEKILLNLPKKHRNWLKLI